MRTATIHQSSNPVANSQQSYSNATITVGSLLTQGSTESTEYPVQQGGNDWPNKMKAETPVSKEVAIELRRLQDGFDSKLINEWEHDFMRGLAIKTDNPQAKSLTEKQEATFAKIQNKLDKVEEAPYPSIIIGDVDSAHRASVISDWEYKFCFSIKSSECRYREAVKYSPKQLKLIEAINKKLSTQVLTSTEKGGNSCL